MRVALLEADVEFRVVREFVARVRDRAAGAEVLQSITPGQQVIGVVHEELVAILGGGQEPLLRSGDGRPTVVLVCGVQGSGKTTLCARLALHLQRDGLRPLLVATDFQRAAASEQLRVLGGQIGVPVHAEDREAPAPAVGKRALAEARRIGADAVDAMTGQEAARHRPRVRRSPSRDNPLRPGPHAAPRASGASLRHRRFAVAPAGWARCRAHRRRARMDPVLPPGGALAVEPHAAERMAELGITEVRVNEAGGILCLRLLSVPIALSRESATCGARTATARAGSLASS